MLNEPDLAVTATGTSDGPRFCRLVLGVATSASAEVVSPLIQPALRVCYVSNTIATSPPIEVVIGGAPPGRRAAGPAGQDPPPG
jgi:hypothetical protein